MCPWAWFTDFGHQVLGKLDPQNGKVTEYQVPILKPEFPPGLLDIELLAVLQDEA